MRGCAPAAGRRLAWFVRPHKVSTRIPLLSLLLLSAVAHAGAWSDDSFGNDDALDWATECAHAISIAPVLVAIETSNRSKYIEAPEGSMAVAAAEVVAAALGRPNPKLPPELRGWVKRNPSPQLIALAPSARVALKRILDPKISELAQLWSEGEPNQWPQAMAELLARLEGP